MTTFCVCPCGYDTEVGERGVMLSGGQKQRISIARALLLEAEILILDDALSAVDGRTEHQILHNLRQWGEGRTVIISAHRLSALTEASEITVLQHGHVAQRGRHEALAVQPGWYRDMYRYQQLEAALDEVPREQEEAPMRSFTELWPTLRRLLAYGSPWRKPLAIAVAMMWIAAAAEVSGPLLISYFIDNMVAKQTLPLKLVAGGGSLYRSAAAGGATAL